MGPILKSSEKAWVTPIWKNNWLTIYVAEWYLREQKIENDVAAHFTLGPTPPSSEESGEKSSTISAYTMASLCHYVFEYMVIWY